MNSSRYLLFFQYYNESSPDSLLRSPRGVISTHIPARGFSIDEVNMPVIIGIVVFFVLFCIAHLLIIIDKLNKIQTQLRALEENGNQRATDFRPPMG